MYDVAGRIFWERDARQLRLRLDAELVGNPLRPRYRFALDTPVTDEERQIRVDLLSFRSHEKPSVFVDGPACLRHRWPDSSLCMWEPSDIAARRWVAADGFRALLRHIRHHLWCEAKCRQGEPWPKEEAPGQHLRPNHCPSCRGRGQ